MQLQCITFVSIALCVLGCQSPEKPAAPQQPQSAKQAASPNTSEALSGTATVSFFDKGAAKALVDDWAKVDGQMSTRPGYRESVLLATASADSPFAYINIALWDDTKKLEEAVSAPEVRALIDKDKGKTGYFEVSRTLGEPTGATGPFMLVVPVTAKKGDDFEARFDKSAPYFTQRNGFQGVILLSKVGGASPFTHVIAARWESEAALRKATDIGEKGGLFNGYESAPGLYIEARRKPLDKE